MRTQILRTHTARAARTEPSRRQVRRLALLALLLLILVALLFASPAFARDASETEAEETSSETPSETSAEIEESSDVELTLGGWDADLDGSPDRVAEYEPVDGGPDLGLMLTSHRSAGSVFLAAHLRDEDDHDLLLDFDVDRSVRSETRFRGLIHRLGHTPLDIYAAVTNHGRIVQHTDLDPTGVYEIAYSELAHRTEVQPRGLPDLTVGVEYRLQEREGLAQAIAVSHCDSCHVTSQSRVVDQQTEDAGVDALVTWRTGSLRASFLHRELTSSAPTPTLVYDDALQPELRIPIFDERLQYDSAEGPLPIHRVPEITKDVGKLRLAFHDVLGFAVRTGAIWSATENELAGLEAEYRGLYADAARALPGDWRLRWRFRAFDLDNDEVFVDVDERRGIAGPAAGQNFQERYGYESDFLRLSALNREVLESKLDASHRFGKKAGTLRVQWDLEIVDRDHYGVALDEGEVETKTTENVLGASWWARPRDGLRLSASARHGEVENPFTLLDGGFSTLFSQRVSSPFDPRAAQYFDFQLARIADRTASPESWDEVKLGANWTLGGSTLGDSMLTASYRYWDGDNEDGDLTDWSRTHDSVTVGLWSAPAPEWQWHVAWAHFDKELKFPTFIPIFDG